MEAAAMEAEPIRSTREGLSDRAQAGHLWHYLSSSLKLKLLGLTILLTLRSLAQVIGVVALVPLVMLVGDPVARVGPLQGIDLPLMALASLSILVVGQFLRFLTTWIQLEVMGQIRTLLSTRLLRGYLHRSYLESSQQHPSDLARNLGEVGHLTAALGVAGNLYSQLLVVALAAGVLAFALPNSGLLILVGLLLIYSLVHLGLRHQLTSLGARRVRQRRLLNRLTHNAFAGLREVKLAGEEQPLEDLYQSHQQALSQAESRVELVASLPLLLLDFAGLSATVSIMLWLFWRGQSGPQLWTQLALILVCLFRLLPALRDLFLVLARLRTLMPSLEVVTRELQQVEMQTSECPDPQREISWEHSIRLEDVHFVYPDRQQGRAALRGIKLEIPCRSSLAIVGETGSGKSTLLHLLMGLYPPSQGRVLVDGQPLASDQLRSWRRQIGFVAQDPFFWDTTLASSLGALFENPPLDLDRCRHLLEQACLDDFLKEGLPEGLQTRIGDRANRLSGGQKQRLGLARALYQQPRLLVLDEATSALDGGTEAAVLNTLKKLQGKVTLVLVAHRLSTVRACQQIVVLDQGELVQKGTFEELMSQSGVFRRLADGLR